MPEVNRRQFTDPLESFLHRENQIEANAGRRFSGPQYEQLAMPGMGRGTEQMRLFDTHRAGPANVYAANPSLDAADWRDVDREVPLSEEGIELVEDDEHEIQGEFFEFPVGRSDREFMAYGTAHHEKIGQTHEEGTHLGHDAYPEKVNPDLRFSDLSDSNMNYDEREWYTDEGTMVGKIEYHEDDWGPNVDHAEINPLYRGRGFSGDALKTVAGGLEPGEGVMHAGSFTSAGSGAFQKKGIPTEDDLERGFGDWVAGLDVDEDDVLNEAEMRYPDEDWSSDDAPQSFLNEIRQDLVEARFDDPDMRMQFRENLEELQAQTLQSLPGTSSRKGAFVEGWKPKGPTRGTQEKFAGMPEPSIASDDWRYRG